MKSILAAFAFLSTVSAANAAEPMVIDVTELFCTFERGPVVSITNGRFVFKDELPVEIKNAITVRGEVQLTDGMLRMIAASAKIDIETGLLFGEYKLTTTSEPVRIKGKCTDLTKAFPSGYSITCHFSDGSRIEGGKLFNERNPEGVAVQFMRGRDRGSLVMQAQEDAYGLVSVGGSATTNQRGNDGSGSGLFDMVKWPGINGDCNVVVPNGS